MPSEKARKLNTREIHLQDFRLYISENMVYPPSALWALDGRLHVPREWGGGGAWNNNTCYKREHLPFLKKFHSVVES